jgi:hypothetical protein
MSENTPDQKDIPPIVKKSLWENLVDAIKGTEADYTKISIRKAIFLLALPNTTSLFARD